MNIVGRRDQALLAGLALALIVAFAGPIQRLLDVAREVDRSSGLTLMPALIILIAVFAFNQQGKRLEARARAAALNDEALDARARASELERLVTFGQALGRSSDLETIRDVVMQQLPTLAGSDQAWVMVRTEGHWQALGGATRDRSDDEAHAGIADRTLVGDGPRLSTDPIAAEGHLCLPMAAGGHVVGILGIPDTAGALGEARRRTLATAATLLGVALRNAQLVRELRETSLRDGLTGCFNRSYALEVIDVELRRARRSQMPVSLIMFDIDRFKDVNDRYGHLCGDAVLAAVGSRMHDVLRGSDLKCRYGGETFLVLLPETPLEGAKRVADTLKREIAEMVVLWKDEPVAVTASLGVTVAMPSEVNAAALISRADAALYRAKEQGRNCVRLSLDTAVA